MDLECTHLGVEVAVVLELLVLMVLQAQTQLVVLVGLVKVSVLHQ
tara:strand:- start:415 stop:549 length:135 start_codon:yes stop_codon:yes gene_type:complete